MDRYERVVFWLMAVYLFFDALPKVASLFGRFL
jgi:hypothetical protein